MLLTGERGTEKTALAEYLHRCSPRAGGAFISVALSTIPDTLAHGEPFGHLLGAFTDVRARRAGRLVSAQGGMLFLDEIGKASSALAWILLRL